MIPELVPLAMVATVAGVLQPELLKRPPLFVERPTEVFDDTFAAFPKAS